MCFVVLQAIQIVDKVKIYSINLYEVNYHYELISRNRLKSREPTNDWIPSVASCAIHAAKVEAPPPVPLAYGKPVNDGTIS